MAEVILQLAGRVVHDGHSVLAEQFHERALGIARQFGGLPARSAPDLKQFHGEIQFRLVLGDGWRDRDGCE
jgi:hypothetical protein